MRFRWRGMALLWAALAAVPAGADEERSAAAAALPEVDCYLLQGPFASRQEACRGALRGADCDALAVRQRLAAAAPYRAIEVAAAPDRGRPDRTRRFALFMRLAAGWFARSLGTSGPVTVEMINPRSMIDEGGHGFGLAERTSFYELPSRLALIDVLPGGAPELVLSYANPDGSFRQQAPEAQQLQLCGIGPTGAPSCTTTLFLTTPRRRPVRSPAELFGPGGEVYELHGDAFRRAVVRLR